MKNYIAASNTLGNFNGIGKIGLENGTGDPVTGFASIITSVIGILTMVAAIYFLFSIVTAAISIMTSGGEKGAYEASSKKLTVGVIGMVIVIAAIFLTDLIAWILGINGILNFGEMINRISPP